MLMPMMMLGTVPMAMDIEDMVDMDMVDTMPDHMDTMEDTGERRRGLLMPTLGMDITDMHIVHMGMDTD